MASRGRCASTRVTSSSSTWRPSIADYVGDTTLSAVVGGKPTPEQQRLMDITYDGLMAGIEAARVGNRLSDIGAAIQAYVERQGLRVVKEFVGHGVGRSMHEAPQVSHLGPGRARPRSSGPGMVVAIEPQVQTWSSPAVMMIAGWLDGPHDGRQPLGPLRAHRRTLRPTAPGS